MFIDSPGAGETFPGVRLGYNLLGRSVLECAKNVAEMTAVAGSGKQRHPQDYNTRLIPPPGITLNSNQHVWSPAIVFLQQVQIPRRTSAGDRVGRTLLTAGRRDDSFLPPERKEEDRKRHQARSGCEELQEAAGRWR
ncbi:hypothetical protein Bbelb_367750 [Branchiostoma belcheri]|nr:hypothetical protein Bbelb_367750 [Branchiostoma belcheri]